MADLQQTVYPHKWSPISCKVEGATGKVRRPRLDVLATVLGNNDEAWVPCLVDHMHCTLYFVGIFHTDLCSVYYCIVVYYCIMTKGGHTGRTGNITVRPVVAIL